MCSTFSKSLTHIAGNFHPPRGQIIAGIGENIRAQSETEWIKSIYIAFVWVWVSDDKKCLNLYTFFLKFFVSNELNFYIELVVIIVRDIIVV